MALLWVYWPPPAGGLDSAWAAAPLDGGEAFELSADSRSPVRRRRTHGDSPASGLAAAWILRRGAPSGELWALLASRESHARVNGSPPPGGLRVLRDRDEIRVERQRFFFSSERLAAVESYAGVARGSVCPRCRQALASGAAVVRCPLCGVVHHQSTELPCWQYAERCAAGCGQETALGGGYRWTPEGL